MFYIYKQGMKIKLGRADIVILASAHNPSIISPQWVKENHLIAEEPKQFVHTPDFSLFDSELLSLIADRQRLQITAKKHDVDTLKSLVGIGKGYIELLPHIPYKALGVNFVWLTEGEHLPKINISIGSTANLSSILTEHELNYGCIIYAQREPYLLKLTIEPQGESTLTYNFNYHHGVTGLDADIIIKYVDNFMNLFKYSQEVVEKFAGGKEDDD